MIKNYEGDPACQIMTQCEIANEITVHKGVFEKSDNGYEDKQRMHKLKLSNPIWIFII